MSIVGGLSEIVKELLKDSIHLKPNDELIVSFLKALKSYLNLVSFEHREMQTSQQKFPTVLII